MMTGKSVFEILEASAAKNPLHDFIITENGSVTNYEEFMTHVERCAAHLHSEFGVTAGDRVVLHLGNTLEFCVATFATLRLGATVVPVNTKLQPIECEHILKNVEPQVVVVSDSYVETQYGFESFARTFDIVGWSGSHGPDQPNAFLPAFHASIVAGDPAFIMFTSGTTGNPKGVVITHANIVRACKTYEEGFGLEPSDITVISVPIFHGTGLFGQLFPLTYVGGTVILQKRYQTAGLLELVRAHRATHFIGVPTMYIYLLQQPGAAECLASLRKAGNGGAPLPETIAEQLIRNLHWVSFFNTYGMTETTSPATMLRSAHFFSKLGSVGKATPGMRARIVDPDTDEECPPNAVGELRLTGELVTPGYWNNPSATEQAFVSEWLCTGDLAIQDDEGYIYLRGRRKDMISRGGEKIYPAEVEEVLLRHEQIVEANVFGVADPVYGETVKAQVVLAPGITELDTASVSAWCQHHLAKFKVPVSYDVVVEIPKNAGGKPYKPRPAV